MRVSWSTRDREEAPTGWVEHRPVWVEHRPDWVEHRPDWVEHRPDWVEHRPRELKSKKKSAGRRRRALEMPLEDELRTTLQGGEH